MTSFAITAMTWYRAHVPLKVRGLIGRMARIGGAALVAFIQRKHMPLDPKVWIATAPAAMEIAWRAMVESPEKAEVLHWLEDSARVEAMQVATKAARPAHVPPVKPGG